MSSQCLVPNNMPISPLGGCGALIFCVSRSSEDFRQILLPLGEQWAIHFRAAQDLLETGSPKLSSLAAHLHFGPCHVVAVQRHSQNTLRANSQLLLKLVSAGRSNTCSAGITTRLPASRWVGPRQVSGIPATCCKLSRYCRACV